MSNTAAHLPFATDASRSVEVAVPAVLAPVYFYYGYWFSHWRA